MARKLRCPYCDYTFNSLSRDHITLMVEKTVLKTKKNAFNSLSRDH